MRELAQEILAGLAPLPVEASEVFLKRGLTREFTWEAGTGERHHQGREEGAALRLWKGGRVGFMASAGLNPQALARDAGQLAGELKSLRAAPGAGLPPLGTPARMAPEPPVVGEGNEAERFAFLQELRQEMASQSKGTLRAFVTLLREGETDTFLANSAGFAAGYRSSSCYLFLHLAAEDGKKKLSTHLVHGGRKFADLRPAKLARWAADRLLIPLSGRSVVNERADVLIDPAVAARILSGIRPLFLGTQHRATLSKFYLGRHGEIASSTVSLADCGYLAQGLTPVPFDGEGTPSQETTIIDGGILRTSLFDHATAIVSGGASTGNAVRPSYRDRPQIGSTNFYIAPDANLSPMDLLVTLKKGYYALHPTGKGDFYLERDFFTLPVSGVAVESGRAVHAISEMVLKSKISTFLQSIRYVAGDLTFYPYGGSVGTPTLFVTGMNLA